MPVPIFIGVGHLGKQLILVEALRGVGVGQLILDKVALLACRGKGEVDPLLGMAQLVDAFSKLPVAGDVSYDPPVVDFLCTVSEDLVVGAVSLEDEKEPLGEGLCGGILVVVNG